MQVENRFQRRRMSLTSLIDVIFLLLLFFMLSSTFSRFGDIELNTGGTGASAQATSPAFARLSERGLALNGVAIEADDLVARIAALKEEDGIDALILAVQESASAQQLVDVLVVARGLDGVALQLVK